MDPITDPTSPPACSAPSAVSKPKITAPRKPPSSDPPTPSAHVCTSDIESSPGTTARAIAPNTNPKMSKMRMNQIIRSFYHAFLLEKHNVAKTCQTQPLAMAPTGVLSVALVRVLAAAVSTDAVGTSTWLWKMLTVWCAPRSSSALPPAAINVELVTVATWSSVWMRSTSFQADPPVVLAT